MVDMAWPGVAATSLAETAQPEPLSVQVAASVAGRMEEGEPEASLADVAMGQASTSMSPTPSTARGAALEELLP